MYVLYCEIEYCLFVCYPLHHADTKSHRLRCLIMRGACTDVPRQCNVKRQQLYSANVTAQSTSLLAHCYCYAFNDNIVSRYTISVKEHYGKQILERPHSYTKCLTYGGDYNIKFFLFYMGRSLTRIRIIGISCVYFISEWTKICLMQWIDWMKWQKIWYHGRFQQR